MADAYGGMPPRQARSGLPDLAPAVRPSDRGAHRSDRTRWRFRGRAAQVNANRLHPSMVLRVGWAMNDPTTLAAAAGPGATRRPAPEGVVDLTRVRIAHARGEAQALERNLCLATDAVELLVDLLAWMGRNATAGAPPGPELRCEALALAARQQALGESTSAVISRAPASCAGYAPTVSYRTPRRSP